MYFLDPRLNRYNNQVHVVIAGCGGTGGWLAEDLCRLYQAVPEVTLVLVDPDRVEEQNLVRQNFLPGDVDQFKAQALAERLAKKYRRPVAYCTGGFAAYQGYKSVVVGCVDNPAARQEISSAFTQNASYAWPGWWIDSGNGANWGQVLVGNVHKEGLGAAFDVATQRCRALPLPSLQRPELLAQEPPAPDPNCAEAVQAGDQSPTINRMMAALTTEVVRRLLAGTCPWMSLAVDLDLGEVRPTFATPEVVARLMRVPKTRLLTSAEQRR